MEKESDLDDILNYRSAAEYEMQVSMVQVIMKTKHSLVLCYFPYLTGIFWSTFTLNA